ncbi:Pogo transposable element with KRAB domainlike [Phytophthora palmivora]|uniref:Pogo transposable element with KRAB domainlike n=1 Tax=Phytophthora palmivora TaxID=4796 RepID=A0A2P4WZE8_9STRA|nr:Pogo transposable element with KRAB domainlike [Phytophthora palmivora]
MVSREAFGLDSTQAHISRNVKAKCSTCNISIWVIPDGLAPYLEAGDIGIYKTDNAWKKSDKVEYIRFGIPRMPSGAVICGWVRKSWRDTDSRTINNSIAAAGFGEDYMEWHVAQHDVYGEKFCEIWGDADATQEVSVTSSNLLNNS